MLCLHFLCIVCRRQCYITGRLFTSPKSIPDMDTNCRTVRLRVALIVDISAATEHLDSNTGCKQHQNSTGAVVVRFHEDASRYWFPVSEVERFLQDMQEHGRTKGSDTIGQGSDNFAAEVLAGALAAQRKTSGATGSSATAGQFCSCTALLARQDCVSIHRSCIASMGLVAVHDVVHVHSRSRH